ncbi:MAG: Uma2 family endonuclease [Peptococcaceae bacterium]|jgi:Uma2 family endonuclease|nr:Uma2 family endonuclease [Peptococcaceae bacterium]
MTTGLTVLDDKVYTIEDYMKLNDGNRYELIGGRLIMTPSAKPIHQKVTGRLYSRIETFLEQNPIGEVLDDVDVHLEGKVVRPDILFFSEGRFDILSDTYPNTAPDLVVEVLSPSTENHDIVTKTQLYYDNGVREYWIVSPIEKWVQVLVVGDRGWILKALNQEDILSTPLLPGLEIKLKAIFV